MLAFGQRFRLSCATFRATGWLGPRWVPTAGPDPWHADAELGPPDFPPPSPRPGNIVNVADAEVTDDQRETVGRKNRRLAAEAGSVTTGLRHVQVTPGKLNAPPHCHSAEEELLVVLVGHGTLLLGDDEIEVRAGSVVSRPAGTGVAHAFRGGAAGSSYCCTARATPTTSPTSRDPARSPCAGSASSAGSSRSATGTASSEPLSKALLGEVLPGGPQPVGELHLRPVAEPLEAFSTSE